MASQDVWMTPRRANRLQRSSPADCQFQHRQA